MRVKVSLFNIIDAIRVPFCKRRQLYRAFHAILGFYPHRISLYRQALVHKSFVGKHDGGDKLMHNERLEFLGDAVLDAVVGDISEAKAIKQLFGDHAYELNISSTKSMTGHLLGAAGAIEAMASVLAVKNDIVPPTINHDEEDRDEEIDYRMNFTFNKAQQRTVRAAMSNTFGFGGHNACVVFKKYSD